MAVNVQIRDVPDEIVEVLKARASARGQSLTAYLRDLLAEEAAAPTVEEVMDRIARRKPIDCDPDDLRGFIEEGRR